MRLISLTKIAHDGPLTACFAAWRVEVSARGLLVVPQVFGRNIVLGDLVGMNLRDVGVGRAFHTADHFRLEGLPVLNQFLDALGISLGDVRQSLGVPGLAGGPRPYSLFSARNDAVGSDSFIVLFIHAALSGKY